MNNSVRSFAATAAFSVLCAASPLAASTIGPIDLFGLEDANNTATVQFDYDGVDKLTVTLKNTSSFNELITGFAFNAASGVTGIDSFSASGFAGADEWDAFIDPDDVSTPQNAGVFDVGAVSENDKPSSDGNSIQQCLNNGDCNIQSGFPGNALGVTDTGLFEFILAGTGLDTLTAADFWTLAKEENGAAYEFVARFQQTGANGSESDVAVPRPTVVPLPAAGWLLIGGIGGLAALKRRKKAKKA